MFVTITNGSHTLKVTEGAYMNFYAPMGYREIVSEAPRKAASKAPEPKPIEERPISKWTKDELRDYAQTHGIDLEGARKVSDVRKVIAAHIAASE